MKILVESFFIPFVTTKDAISARGILVKKVPIAAMIGAYIRPDKYRGKFWIALAKDKRASSLKRLA
jgi:hypothetical protein